jgi:RNA polymerase sigma factor (TIGR02999 family)
VPPSHDVTSLLVAWSRGDRMALDRMLPLVYGQLREIAARQFRRESPGHTLQPTALVHEAYLKLIDQTRVDWKNRAQFFGVAAQMMRRILIDHARAQRTAKRGGAKLVSLDTATAIVAALIPDVLVLDEVLARLSALDPRKGQLVELRCFGGLTIEEAAHVLAVSETTIKQEWRLAKAWLHRELRRTTRDVPGVRGVT